MKIIKKICGLFGYKLIDKNHFKNNRLVSSHSFFSINKLLNILFENKNINSIVQIGANDGVRFDILNNFIEKYQIKSLLVEPINEYFQKLSLKYKNSNFVSIENSAISINNEISFLYKVDSKYLSFYDDHIPGISSFDKNHLLKHGVKKRHIIKEKINSININELLNKHNIKDIDLLYIDAEGYDGKIVIDFITNTTLTPIIIFEYIHVDNKILSLLLSKLKNIKYKIFSINENLVCYPNNKLINLDN
jgi:FkbM family methyltransferase